MTDVREDKASHCTSFTDSNDYCLLRIFENLDMQTLLSVAMLDGRLNDLPDKMNTFLMFNAFN